MKKVVALVAGTRPDAIKMAPVWFARRASATLQPLLISTDWHREMLDQAFAVAGGRFHELPLGVSEGATDGAGLQPPDGG